MLQTKLQPKEFQPHGPNCEICCSSTSTDENTDKSSVPNPPGPVDHIVQLFSCLSEAAKLECFSAIISNICKDQSMKSKTCELQKRYPYNKLEKPRFKKLSWLL